MNPFDFLGHAVRAKEIIAVLARHGFADLLNQIELPPGLRQRFAPQRGARVRHTHAERLRLVLEDLGPTFIKAGQLLSMRPDVLPHTVILELQKLQSGVPALPFPEMRPVLVEELGAEPDAVFATFDEKAVASASLAQVYFATLKDGREVAVKIQRPDIRRGIEADLDLLAWFAGQIHQRVEGLRPYDLPAVADEIRQGVLRELDFEHEARNQRFFNALNPDPEHVFAPAVVEELCSRRLLVMDRVYGRPVHECGLTGEAAHNLAAAAGRSLVHQVLVAGFFHADPHGGNVIVTADGRLCFLDWGMAGHLTKRLRHALADLFIAAADQDAEAIVQIAAELGSPGGRADLRAMERDVTLALREDFNRAINHVELGRAMLKLLHIFGRNGINITRDYSLMAKAILSIEEIAGLLDPSFDLRRIARSSLVELQRERSGPRTLWREARAFLRTAVTGLREVPGELHRIIRRIEHDELTIKFQHQGLDDIDDALKSASSRITLGVIIAALIVGSSLIITTRVEPYLFGYPALGIIGYLLSALLGVYVIWDIFRHGHHK